MKSLITFVSLLLLCTEPLFAQQTTAFNRYPDAGSDYMKDGIPLSDGDMLFLGYRRIMRTDANGILKWNRNFSILLSKALPCSNSTLMVAGILSNGFCIGKMDTSGHVLWMNRLYRSSRTTIASVINTYDHKIVIQAVDSLRTLIIKADTSGNILWSRHFYNAPVSSISPGASLFPGNLIELPDHNYAVMTTTIAPISTFSGPVGTASMLKVSPNGDLLWARKMSYYIPPFTTATRGFAGADIFRLSNNTFACSIYSGSCTTLITDTLGNPISGPVIFVPMISKVVSEWPVGTVNIFEVGGENSDVIVSHTAPQLIKSSLDLSTVNVTRYLPPGAVNLPPYGFTFDVSFQRADRQFVFAGLCESHGFAANSDGHSIIVTDSNGYQSCTSLAGSIVPSTDTSLHAIAITMLVDSGINVQPITYTDSLVPMRHCNCDSMPVARFGLTNIGSTIYFHDSSTHALTHTWYFGDQSQADTNTNPVHTYTDSLNHYITLTVTNHCGSGIYRYHLTPADTVQPPPPPPPTGVNVASTRPVYQLFPNPARTQLHVSPALPAGIDLHVYDELGRMVTTKKSSDNISLTGLSAGHYLLVFVKDAVPYKLRFVKW